MRRSYLLYFAIVAVVLMVSASVFAVVTVRRSFPQVDGEENVVGLRDQVEVMRDSHGIPQIYADNPTDLFFAQGYVQAQDRFFEMDFRRHLTAGRLSELVGEDAIDTDKFVRTLGWRRVARREVEQLQPATRRYLEAYSDGVNAYIEDKSAGELSLEYTVLSVTGPDYVPEPWTPVDSVAWLKAMAWDLRSNMDDEIDRVLATQDLSAAQVEELYPAYPYKRHDPIVTAGRIRKGRFQDGSNAALSRAAPAPQLSADTISVLRGIRDASRDLPDLLGTGALKGLGSNSWVVSGDHTESGSPLLANDPHLAPSMPGVWYQMGLHCNDVTMSCPFDVSGFTFAGMPGVIIGHNDRIAWGLTTMYSDVSDLYLEDVDDSAGTYRYRQKELPLRTRTEDIRVAGRDDPVTITVRSTRHGPLISDVDDDAADAGSTAAAATAGAESDATSYAVALRWTALQTGRTMDAIFGINEATNWRQFHRAAKHLDVPSQNLVYADVDGHIGYQATGRIPIRQRGDGRWPVPGWDPRYEWVRDIPYRQLPSVRDPKAGYIVTANQAVFGRKYPYRLTSDSAYGYRSQRIIDLLKGKDQLSVGDMAEMQKDTFSANAERLVPYLLDIKLPGGYYRSGQRLLQDWDFTQPASSGAAAYFNVVWRDLLALTFHDQLPEAVWPDGGERWFEVVSRIIDDPNSSWWDDVTTDEIVENRYDILRQALLDARDDMTMYQARDAEQWTWGHIHKLKLENQTLGKSGVGLVETMFNRGPYEVGGGSGAVDATSWDAADGFEVTSAPSMRMVVDLSNFDDSRWIQLTGESGHAYAGNYADQTTIWADGQTLPWAYTRDAVDAAQDHELVLTPVDQS
ncbi:MAG TPA: penicillin acylase family protein [Nocardioidaceae bacterium]|nr:penicillin acylase family protein [Nocardioidaceae bacterium]